MGKLSLRSLKRISAKQKPERNMEYIEALFKAPGIYNLLLDPILNEQQEIVDFRILLASQSFNTLENQQQLEGSTILSAMKSAPQWFPTCKRLMESGKSLLQNIHHRNDGESKWFKGFFTKEGNWVVVTWHPYNLQRGLREPWEKVNRNDASVQNDKDLKSHKKNNSKNHSDLTEPEGTEILSPHARTIRNIIHEIRNPLTAIALANQLLMETSKEEKNEELSLSSLTSIIFQNSKKIEDHLRQLLLPKTEEETHDPMDLCEIVESALQKAENRLFLGRVKVCRNFSPGLYINGQGQKLSLAFLNLIINAIEAMPNENGRLWISIYPVENSVKVIIRDNGVGMDTEILKRIFEVNFSNKKNGLGLGLANVKEILDQHQATISVTSELKKGSSFTILFRQAPGSANAKINSAQSSLDI